MGFTLGKYLTEHGKKVTGYYSRNTHSAREAAQFTDTKACDSLAELIHESDVLFLTVPDSSITSVYEEIAAHPIRGKYICHCSGEKTSAEAFPGIDKTGAYEYSVHPLFAVSDKYHAYEELPDVFFTIEGNKDHLDGIRGMLSEAGLQTRLIDPADKTRYHAAAAAASNLVIGLLDQSISMLCECGFSEEDARAALTPLVLGNVRHLLRDGTVQALTGPVERSDTETVRKHLASLDSRRDRVLYSLLSLRLADIAQRKHPDRDYTAVEKILEEFAE